MMNPFDNTTPEPTKFINLIHISDYEECNFYFQNTMNLLNIKEYKSAIEIANDGLFIDPDNISLLILKAKILTYSNHNLPAKIIEINLNEALRIFNLVEVVFKRKYTKLLKVKDIRLISKDDLFNWLNDKIKLNGLKEILKLYFKHFEMEIIFQQDC